MRVIEVEVSAGEAFLAGALDALVSALLVVKGQRPRRVLLDAELLPLHELFCLCASRAMQ
jgi:hypothetical protein